MISLSDVTLRRGAKMLFEHGSVLIPPGAKVGLVGRNGSGKTSLLHALHGELAVDAGELRVPAGLAIARLRQETPATSRPALEYVKDGDEELRRIEREIEGVSDGHRLAGLHAALDAIDGYSADARAAKLLAGLGFEPPDATRPVDEFSGGWRMRLNLAQALMSRSDLLLLDEPTNHLDFETVIWLEGWLRRYPGTLVLVSHDREFLDHVIDRVIHLDGRGLTEYPGDYSRFERSRAERLALQAVRRARQEREAARIGRFVERFRAKATKARQAQSRLKALERMERVAVAHAEASYRFAFARSGRCPDPLVALREVSARYGEEAPVLRDVHLVLTPGMRLGLLGHNGAGKSTLVRVLAGLHPPCAGQRTAHPGLRIGYFDQHQLERLDPEATPLLHLRRSHPSAPEQQLRDLLGGFGFRGDEADAPVENLSGGEKARLVLALLAREAPHLLLLDEPTNHLDLDMRHALEVALQDFEGALVLVSHDRHLLRTTTDELVVVADGRTERFAGDLDEYERGLGAPPGPAAGETARTVSTEASEPEGSVEPRRAQRREAAAARERRRPVLERIRRIEKVVADLTAETARLDLALADPQLYEPENKAALHSHLFDRARAAQRIDALEAEWLELEEALERIG